MDVLPVLVSVVPIGLAVAVGWLLLRMIGQRGSVSGSHDAAVTLRRFLLYALCYITLLVAAQGLVELADEIMADRGRRSNVALARALAFLIVGLPAYGALIRWVDRRLVDDADERRSPAWTLYLIVALGTTLIVAMVEAHTLLRALLSFDGGGFDGEAELDGRALVATMVWGGLWAGHWFVLRRRHPTNDDIDLATGTVAGLVPLAVGAAGLIHVVGDELYNRLTDDPDSARNGPSAGAWLATAIVGAIVWGWYWLANYRRGRRTELWHVIVVPIGALTGFVAVAAGGAVALHTVVVWLVGDPDSSEAVRHFDSIPVMVAIALVGAASLLYHRLELGTETHRNDAIRSYDYLLAIAALVTTIVGVCILLIAVFGNREVEGVNTLLAGVTAVLVGGPVWLWFWRAIERNIGADRRAELQSPWRRIYLFTIFGGGGLAVLIATLAVLSIGLEHLLDGRFGRETLHDMRVGLAVLIAVAGVSWYHFTVFWAERTEYAPPVQSPPPPPLKSSGVLQRVVLVAGTGDDDSGDDDLADRFSEAIGAPVTHWHRTDHPARTSIDADDLRRLLADRTDPELLVVVGADEPTIIPFTTIGATP